MYKDVLRPSAITPDAFGHFWQNKSASSIRTKLVLNEVTKLNTVNKTQKRYLLNPEITCNPGLSRKSCSAILNLVDIDSR